MKYVGAISDTDILINLAKAYRLDILGTLFKEIIIPQYVYDREIRFKAGKYYSTIEMAIREENSIFTVLDRKKDRALNFLAKEIIEDKKQIIGTGESECAGYASAMRIPIIISDNYTEFKFLSEYITLTHRNILTLCVYFNKITLEEAKEIFNTINQQLGRPTSLDFDSYYKNSLKRFNENGWNGFLGL